MKRLFRLIILLLIIAETCLSESATSQDEEGEVLQPTKTKTVYGFLDFTTTVSDTVMVFKPSKTPAGKGGRNVGGASRTASVLRSKPSAKNRPDKIDIESSPPEQLEVSVSPAEIESSTGRSGGGFRPRTGKPVIRAKPGGGEVQIEGSLIHLDEPTASFSAAERQASSTERLKALRRQQLSNNNKDEGSSRGTGSVVSSFPLMHSHVAVSSRVDVRIGGLSKVGKGSAIPHKEVGVRMEVKVAPEEDSEELVDNKKATSVMPVGQSLVSKTVGTRIQDGLTTIHETSIIGTTIDGQFAHFVQSTSRIFQEPSAAPQEPGIPGSVEVVTDLPTLGISPKNRIAPPTTTAAHEESSEDNLEPLPSLESLFKSVQADEGLPAPEQLIARKKPAPEVLQEEESGSAAVVLKPSYRLTTTPSPPVVPKSPVERRTGLASSSPRPQRTEEQRWRYNPSAKPKVAIQRTGSNGSRNRVTTPARDESVELEDRTNQQNHETDSQQQQQQQKPAPVEIDPTEVITLRVQTVTPEGYSNIYYEVATIKSPYIMRLGAIRNTRYVTLTRSFTRLFTTTPAPVGGRAATVTSQDYDELPEPDPEILLDPSNPLPDPENILATTPPYENILKDSSDTATLPAIIVASTEESGELAMSLRTVTETFSTTELSMKTSVLPYLRAGATSFMTLTQSYFVTRVVVAVKTVPPEDLYQFIPSKTLTDFATNLQEAGSEHNERLLPGELEFSENDEFADEDADGEEHRHEKRVPAPPGDYRSKDDLSIIGQDFDPSQINQPQQVELEPSLVDAAAENSKLLQGSTPPLPINFGQSPQLEPSIGNPLQQQQQGFPSVQQDGTPILSPEQLQQLALFRYMNPYGGGGLPYGYPGFGGGQGIQVITTSRPVVKTTDIIKTETVSIWDGAKTIYSTLTRVKGTTVVTETEYGTTTIAAPMNPLFGPQQQFTVVSSPVVTEITTTSTELRIYRIIFRAQTTYTTVTSTSVFPTLVTTYVSSTIPIQPTAFPQGLFPGSYPFQAFG